MLGARQDRMLQHSSPCWKQRGECGGEESRTWVPSQCPRFNAITSSTPGTNSSKAVSQLGASWFWGQLSCSGPWKWDQSLWLWGRGSTWQEQRSHEQLNSRRGFPAFIKRHAANNAAIWQTGWKEEECLFKKALLITTTSREMRSRHLLIFHSWSHTLKKQNKYAKKKKIKTKTRNTKDPQLLFLKRWYGFSKSICILTLSFWVLMFSTLNMERKKGVMWRIILNSFTSLQHGKREWAG